MTSPPRLDIFPKLIQFDVRRLPLECCFFYCHRIDPCGGMLIFLLLLHQAAASTSPPTYLSTSLSTSSSTSRMLLVLLLLPNAYAQKTLNDNNSDNNGYIEAYHPGNNVKQLDNNGMHKYHFGKNYEFEEGEDHDSWNEASDSYFEEGNDYIIDENEMFDDNDTLSKNSSKDYIAAVAAANYQFTLKFLSTGHRMNANHLQGNIIFSPSSLSMVLTMLATGAQGEALKQLKQGLSLPIKVTLQKNCFPCIDNCMMVFRCDKVSAIGFISVSKLEKSESGQMVLEKVK